jgi:hypothetical protein
VHEDDERVGRHLGEAGAYGVRTGRTARDARVGLAAAELLGEQDGRLLPARRRDDDDPVDPVGVFEAAQRLGEEWVLAELRERLG